MPSAGEAAEITHKNPMWFSLTHWCTQIPDVVENPRLPEVNWKPTKETK